MEATLNLTFWFECIYKNYDQNVDLAYRLDLFNNEKGNNLTSEGCNFYLRTYTFIYQETAYWI